MSKLAATEIISKDEITVGIGWAADNLINSAVLEVTTEQHSTGIQHKIIVVAQQPE